MNALAVQPDPNTQTNYCPVVNGAWVCVLDAHPDAPANHYFVKALDGAA
jgi:hypothetical protein